MAHFAPPYLGAAYYPEAWPPGQVDEDIRWMLEAGMNVMRVGEFAWSSIEPEEGRFELDWLRRVVDKLGDAGIATIMCTVSCTPPAWLTWKHPEVLVVDHAGRTAQHGYRRHVCPNNPLFRAHCERTALKLAEVFGRDERVIGWQIDNEVYLWEEWGCYCGLCQKTFRQELQAQFGSIDALNQAWGTNVWSQTYQSFDQIPAPRPEHCHHPSLLTAWSLSQNESYVGFVAAQAAVLHDHVVQPVGTDMMPFMGLSYEQIHRHLDLVQYNHYDTMEDLWQQVFWMDYVRTIKAAPFWNTETATCWNGGVTANGYKEPGFCRVNSWLPIALGGEANLYWLWRSHWSGQELMHGSVISSAGRPLHIFGEVQEISRGFKESAEFLNGTRPTPPGFAMHLSTLAWTLFRFQPMVRGFDYLECMKNRAFRPLMDIHLRADIIDPSTSLEAYRVVFSPFLPALDESGLRERLLRWIENGGTWIAGPFTDVRTLEGAKPTHAPFVGIEEWARVYCKYEIPGDPRDFEMSWDDGHTSLGSLWYSGFETKAATVRATYTEGPLKGLAAVTETSVGQGRIVLLGTALLPQDLQRLMLHYAAEQEIGPVIEASPNVLVVPRCGEAGEGVVVVELQNRPGTIHLPAPAKDLISKVLFSGDVDIAPYQVLVLHSTARKVPSVSSDSAPMIRPQQIPQPAGMQRPHP